jgi:hypothetical protein
MKPSTTVEHTAAPVSWWSWRPGISPQRALLIALPLVLLASLLIGIGLISLLAALLDSQTAPLTINGTVVGHSTGSLDRLPRLEIRLQAAGFPPLVTPVVPAEAFAQLHDGEQVQLLFSPHLHALRALRTTEHSYQLSEGSAGSNLAGSLALLGLGLLLMPYPATLLFWGWRDLYSPRCQMYARVVARRAVERQRSGRAGATPHSSTAPWYGLALLPVEGTMSTTARPLTFSVSPTLYQRACAAESVLLTYSPHLHYVYTLEPLA